MGKGLAMQNHPPRAPPSNHDPFRNRINAGEIQGYQKFGRYCLVQKESIHIQFPSIIQLSHGSEVGKKSSDKLPGVVRRHAPRR